MRAADADGGQQEVAVVLKLAVDSICTIGGYPVVHGWYREAADRAVLYSIPMIRTSVGRAATPGRV